MTMVLMALLFLVLMACLFPRNLEPQDLERLEIEMKLKKAQLLL